MSLFDLPDESAGIPAPLEAAPPEEALGPEDRAPVETLSDPGPEPQAEPPAEAEAVPLRAAADDDRAVLAAIAAAAEVCWPRPVVLPAEVDAQGLAWRFSGRWWREPVALRRDRSSARR
ncbi:MAG: hypothetical protein ACYCS7_10260 [Acidimicrobiales bacterium]